MTPYETVKLALQDSIATQRSATEELYLLKTLDMLEELKPVGNDEALEALDELENNNKLSTLSKLALANKIRAALQSQAAPNEWQPIETAPKDVDILVHYDDGEISLIRAEENDYTYKPYSGKERPFSKLTHWQPLPKPPNKGQIV